MKLADWLKDKRGTMTVRQFAEAVGVHEGTVHKWMTGENVPRPRPMTEIIRLTGGAVSPTDFYAAHAGCSAAPAEAAG